MLLLSASIPPGTYGEPVVEPSLLGVIYGFSNFFGLSIIFIIGVFFLVVAENLNKKLVVLNWIVTLIMSNVLYSQESLTSIGDEMYHANETLVYILLIFYLILIKVFKNEGNVDKKKKIIGISIAIHIILQAIILFLGKSIIPIGQSTLKVIIIVFWIIEVGLAISNYIVAIGNNEQEGEKKK